MTKAAPRTGSRDLVPLKAALPPILAVALAVPCLRFPWLWDDYDFLAHAQTFQLHDLLPREDILFWRPLSRELWFALLWRVAPHTPLIAHLLHALLVAVAVLLVRSVAARLFGARAGFLAAILYAALGAQPMLIGWASASQDLFATIFFLAALHFRLAGRLALSLLAAALALLSKETAAFLVPLLAVTPWIVGNGATGVQRAAGQGAQAQEAAGTGSPRRPLLDLGLYGALLAAWLASHAGIHTLLARGFAPGEKFHVEIGGVDRLPLLGRGLLTLVNLPIPGGGSGWRDGTGTLLLGAAALVFAGVWLAFRRAPGAARTAPGGRGAERNAPWNPRGAALAAAIAILPAVGTTALLKVWAPYYAALPGIGTTMLLGAALARTLPAAALVGALLFMGLGVYSRGQPLDQSTPTERNYEKPAQALAVVERGFKSLQPTLPKGAHLLVSVASTGALQVYTHIHFLQAPRVWYGDPTIQVLRPNRRRPGDQPEFLFRITPTLDVIEIDPMRWTFRSSGAQPEADEVVRPLRMYARALAATGEVDRGVAIYGSLEEVAQGDIRIIERRYAVMLLLAAGRSAEAARLVQGVPDVPRQVALDIITRIYEDALPDTTLEEASFPAFGVDPRDLEANRYIMRRANRESHFNTALRVARRIQAIAPGDAESRDLIREIEARPPRDLIIVPVLSDSL